MTGIIITGMHRSGTSMVARLLNLCGVSLGDETRLLGAAPDNQAGFWENQDVTYLNDKILNSAMGGWDFPPQQMLVRPEYQQEAQALLAPICDTDQPWAIKDPRIALLTEFWRAMIPEVRTIICLRDPYQVAASLAVRNGLSIPHGYWLWNEYNLRLMERVPFDERFTTHIDAYQERPERELRRMLRFLEIEVDDQVVTEACESIRPELWHHTETLPDEAPNEVAQLYRMMCNDARITVNCKNWLSTIVIVTHGGLEHTERCLASIREHTHSPYEIVLVDNASQDDTPAWITEYANAHDDVRALLLNDNIGFAGGVNQGLAMSRGQYIVLLNNDTLVTDDWLERLLMPFRFENIGMVGAMSNRSLPSQTVSDVPYSNDEGLAEFADDWARANAGQMVKVHGLSGFCLAIKQELVGRIGAFDERFFPGNYEDNDYGFRAIIAGWSLALARDVFIHHVGGVAFDDTWEDSMETNWGRYKEKWDIPAEVQRGDTYMMTMPKWDADKHYIPLPELVNQDNTETVSMVMIVRDEAENLRDCLAPVLDWVDEIIVVDTGSTDDTREIANGLGCTVVEFAWCDDFAAARNHGLAHATGDWIFWMDADDRIEMKAIGALRKAIDGHKADAFMCQVTSKCPNGLVIATSHLALFRNHRGVQFEGALHEDATISALRAGLRIVTTDIPIRHLGYEQTKEQERVKLIRNRDIIVKQLAGDPSNLRTRYHLANILYALGDGAGAIANAKPVILNPPATLDWDTEVYQAHYLSIATYANTGQRGQAEALLGQTFKRFAHLRHLSTLAGMLNAQWGEWDRALEHYRHAETMEASPLDWDDSILPERIAEAVEQIGAGGNGREALAEPVGEMA